MSKNLESIAVLFSVFIFLLYISTLSISMDDEDSVHFALGLREFNVTKYQPHPPGFPVYIVLGMAFNVIFRNELLSLTFMSALFGALTVFVFYVLSREMFNKETALLSSILLAFTPLFWLNSVKAMSDMTGFFFIVLSMLFLYRYLRYGKPYYLYVSALVLGVSAGVRIHSLFVLLPPLIYVTYRRGSDARTVLVGGGIFIAAILMWFIPLLIVTGAPEYFSSTESQLTYRIGRSYISIIGSEAGLGGVTERLIGFPYFFLLGGYGVNLAGLGILSILLLLLMIVLGLVFLRKVNPRDERCVFFSTGLAPYLLMVFVLLPPFNPRYLLLLVPLLSLAFTLAICRVKKSFLKYVLFGFFLFLLLSHSLFLALLIRTVPSPPVQLIEYVNRNYGPRDVVLLSGFLDKYFTYYGTNLTRLPETVDCDTIRKLLSEGRKVLSIRGNERCGMNPVEKASFHRDPRVHIKRSTLNLYEISAQ